MSLNSRTPENDHLHIWCLWDLHTIMYARILLVSPPAGLKEAIGAYIVAVWLLISIVTYSLLRLSDFSEQRDPSCVLTTRAFMRCQTQNILAHNIFSVARFIILCFAF